MCGSVNEEKVKRKRAKWFSHEIYMLCISFAFRGRWNVSYGCSEANDYKDNVARKEHIWNLLSCGTVRYVPFAVSLSLTHTLCVSYYTEQMRSCEHKMQWTSEQMSNGKTQMLSKNQMHFNWVTEQHWCDSSMRFVDPAKEHTHTHIHNLERIKESTQ